MKFSEKWLREWVNPSLSAHELSEQLSMAGLEVDGVEEAEPLERVVAAPQLLAAHGTYAPHPRLELTDHPVVACRGGVTSWTGARCGTRCTPVGLGAQCVCKE